MISNLSFYKERHFVKNEAGEFPYDWISTKLGEVITEGPQNGIYKHSSYYGEGVPIIRIENINKGYYVKSEGLKKIRLDENELKIYSVTENDIILNRVNSIDYVGKSILIKGLKEKMVFESNMMRFKFDTCQFYPDFLIHYLNSIHVLSRLRNKAKRAVQQSSVNQEDIRTIDIPKINYCEQINLAKIVEIFERYSNITDMEIGKIEKIKNELMTVLINGIEKNNFVNNELGKIPMNWEIVNLNSVAEIRSSKNVNDYKEIPFIPMELISDRNIFASYEIRKKEKIKSFTYCESGDILLAKITPSLENGKQGIVPLDIPMGRALATTEVFPIRCYDIEPLYLYYVLKMPQFRNKIIASMIGTTGRQRASKDSLEKLLIPKPPKDEQKEIMNTLKKLDDRIDKEIKEKNKIDKIKNIITNDLFTGKIRVRND